jgi:Ricin-type beta-trefoil lectin domain-like
MSSNPSPEMSNTPARSLVNQAPGLCLDDPGFQTANGTQFQVYSCNGGSNQHWWPAEV